MKTPTVRYGGGLVRYFEGPPPGGPSERHRLLAVVGAIAALAKLDASDPACDFSEVEALGRELVEAARLIRKARNRSAW